MLTICPTGLCSCGARYDAQLFHREKRSNDPLLNDRPDAMPARKSRGTEAVLAYRGHLLTHNRNGLVASTLTTRAYSSAE